ncbi:MAG: ABC transporter permease [Lachnospiraceae bacterium]|nr:ABC transporter permease [Lachnospiraceae bacterium]
MRLYKMELYKICSKKFFIIGVICVIGLVLLKFSLQVMDEEATVNGTSYIGFRAIKVNREITEEFKGIITDEKIEKIVEKYGLPSKVERGWGYFRDANFLNQFVLDYCSNGYIHSENDYKIATEIYPIADSLGKAEELTGKGVVLEYYHGLEAFLEVLSFGMVLGSILVIVSLSGIFAGEGQTKMLPLLFTTKEGKTRDVYAKIAAALTVTIGVWMGIFFLDLVLCGIVYGFDGMHCYNGMVLYYLFPSEEYLIPMYEYMAKAILLNFFGIVSLCFMTISISAFYKSSFSAIITAAVWYAAPVLAMMFIDGFYGIARLLAAAPVFMVIYRIVDDIYQIWLMLIWITIIVSLFCAKIAYRKYNRQIV